MLTSYKLFVGQVRPRASRRAAAAAQRAIQLLLRRARRAAVAAGSRAVATASRPPRPPRAGALTFTAEQLRSTFEPFGEIQDITIVHDKQSGASKGCGFVTFSSESSAWPSTSSTRRRCSARARSRSSSSSPTASSSGWSRSCTSRAAAHHARVGRARALRRTAKCVPSASSARPPPPSPRRRDAAPHLLLGPRASSARARAAAPPPHPHLLRPRRRRAQFPSSPPRCCPPPPPPLTAPPPSLARPDEGKSYAFVEYATRAEATAAIGAPPRRVAPHLPPRIFITRIYPHLSPGASPASPPGALNGFEGVEGSEGSLVVKMSTDSKTAAAPTRRRSPTAPPARRPPPAGYPPSSPRRRHRGVRVAAGVRVGAGGYAPGMMAMAGGMPGMMAPPGYMPMGAAAMGGGGGGESGGSGFKLFVGMIPYATRAIIRRNFGGACLLHLSPPRLDRYTTGEAELHQLFAQFGPLVEVFMMRDKDGKSKGCAFVRFAQRAVPTRRAPSTARLRRRAAGGRQVCKPERASRQEQPELRLPAAGAARLAPVRPPPSTPCPPLATSPVHPRLRASLCPPCREG